MSRGRGDASTTVAHDPKGAELVLIVLWEKGTFTVPLPAQRTLVVGRGADCDVRIDDSSVSRKHAALSTDPLRVEDLGSRNGTRVLDRKLDAGMPTVVPIGASIEMGSVTGLVQRATGSVASSHPPTSPTSGAAHGTSFIAVDAQSKRLVRLVEVVAQRPSHVLVAGEPGVGKDAMARLLHERSPRAAGPFVVFDGVASLERLPSEGQDGARGAESLQSEREALADAWRRSANGTLYVDAVDALPLDLQKELARRIGEPRLDAWPDVRVVASLRGEPSDPERGLARLGEELLRGVSGFTFRIPALRDRTADIRPLAERFLEAAAGGRRVTLARGALARLEGHAWRSNVRELERVVNAALLACKSDRIEEDDLELVGVEPSAVTDKALLHEAVEVVERQRVLDALARAGGNQTRAARELGIARGTLIARLETYGVARPRKRDP